MRDFDPKQTESLELDLTSICNARCKLCFRQSKTFPEKFKKPHVRKLADVQAQLESFPKLKQVELIGQMSDPLCYPHLPELVAWLKARKIQIRLYTNGSFSQEWVREVGKQLRADDEVKLTVCGLDQKQHEIYRCGTSLAKILEANRVLSQECHVRTAMAYLVFGYNRDTVNSSRLKLLSKLFSDTAIVKSNVMQPVSDFGIDSAWDVFTDPASKPVFAEIEKLADESFADPSSDQVECVSLQQKRAFVSCFGDVYPCWFFFELEHETRDWSYADILAKKHRCCHFCQQSVKKLVEASGFGGA